MKPFVLAPLSILLSVLAQVMLKRGMTQLLARQTEQGHAQLDWHLIASSITQPWVGLGFLLYGLGAVMWLLVLARWDVSKAYPLVGCGFLATLAISYAFLGERISLGRCAGVVLISFGIILVARS